MGVVATSDGGLGIGERVRYHRTRRGLSRRALAELLGRSEEWLRLLEMQDRGAERLVTLQRLVTVLQLPGLAALVGPCVQDVTTQRRRHALAHDVHGALSRSLLRAQEDPTVTQVDVDRRIAHAWAGWNSSREQYTAVAVELPELVAGATAMIGNAVTDQERRRAHAGACQAFLLAQRYAACVGEPDLAARATDRAVLEAEQAEDPALRFQSLWAAAMTALAANRPQESLEVALGATQALTARLVGDDREREALTGSLLLFAAISSARLRRAADTWRFWDRAARIASSLGAGFDHQRTHFGITNVGVYAVAISIELGESAVALDRSLRVPVNGLSSSNRRAQHHADVARAARRTGDPGVAVASLRASLNASRESLLFSADTTDVVDWLLRGPDGGSDEVARIGRHLGSV